MQPLVSLGNWLHSKSALYVLVSPHMHGHDHSALYPFLSPRALQAPFPIPLPFTAFFSGLLSRPSRELLPNIRHLRRTRPLSSHNIYVAILGYHHDILATLIASQTTILHHHPWPVVSHRLAASAVSRHAPLVVPPHKASCNVTPKA